MTKICVVTGSRAEYGLLSQLMNIIKNSLSFELQLLVTGSHLNHLHGNTISEIKNDGFDISKRVDLGLTDDTPASVVKSAGRGMSGFSDAMRSLDPDILLVLGDRYEIFSSVFCALILGIPVAHIHGGEITEGAFDDSIRHSITKMSHWHFVAAKEYKNRVVQLGENPERVFNVGGLGVDSIKNINLLPKNKLTKKFGINFKEKNILITYHPVTLSGDYENTGLINLLNFLEQTQDIFFIFTMPNADPGYEIIKKLKKDFVNNNIDRAIYFDSMGHKNFLSTMNCVDAIVGNSSSGILEAPTFKIATINIGERQEGRLKAKSIIDCSNDIESIRKAFKKIYSEKFQAKLLKVKNPYGNGNAAKKIMSILQNIQIPSSLKKKFYEI